MDDCCCSFPQTIPREPRFQINEDLNTQQVFGIDVEGLKPGQEAIVDASAFGYPVRSLAQVAAR